jgi:hypothetical protein
VADIVVRINRLPAADEAAFGAWLEETGNALRGNLDYSPEGAATAFTIGSQAWHNLPFSFAGKDPPQRLAFDLNTTQYGLDAVSVSFYFPLPPEPGVMDRLIPQVLGSLQLAGPARTAP